VINSTQVDLERLEVYFKLAIEADASLIALTMDKQGVPQDVDRRVELAGNIVMAAMEAGYPIERLFIDPIIQPVKFAQTQAGIVLQALGQIRYLSNPPPRLVVGLRNISQGTQERALIDSAYLVMCVAMGLDAAIMDPFDKGTMDAMITAELLLNKQIYSDSFLDAYRASAKAELKKNSLMKKPFSALSSERSKRAKRIFTDGKKRYSDGLLEEQYGFSILHLKGSPYDMGYQQGMLTREAMGAMAEPRVSGIFVLGNGEVVLRTCLIPVVEFI
jgi:cobalamin-dependent methionine synthase I